MSDITKTEVKPISTNDPRLQFVLDSSKDACKVFVEAIRNSSDEHIEVSFKAFTLTADKDEAKSIFEIIMTAVAIELKETASDLIDKYTFYNSQEDNEDEHILLLHCRKEKAPVAEQKVVEIEEEEEKKEENIVLPHASGMNYFRPGGE